MKTEDKKYLDKCIAKFKKLGLDAEYEVSYGFGEGCYDIRFLNGGRTFEEMQLNWTNAEKAKEEWGGFEGNENPGSAWGIAAELGGGLLDDDEYITKDFEKIIEVLVRLIGGPKLFDINTVNGLRNYLNYLSKLGKGEYKISDMKGNELTQNLLKVNEEYKCLDVDARFYEGFDSPSHF